MNSKEHKGHCHSHNTSTCVSIHETQWNCRGVMHVNFINVTEIIEREPKSSHTPGAHAQVDSAPLVESPPRAAHALC